MLAIRVLLAFVLLLPGFGVAEAMGATLAASVWEAAAYLAPVTLCSLLAAHEVFVERCVSRAAIGR